MKYIIGLLWIISLLAAYYVGNSLQQENVNDDEARAKPTQFQLTASPNISQEKVRTASVDPHKGPSVSQHPESTEQLDPSTLVQQAKTLLENGSRRSLSKIAQAYNLIQNLNPVQLLAALSEIDTNALDDDTSQLFSILLSRYAEFEPQNAMAFVEQQNLSGRAQTTAKTAVLNTWADSDPLAALDWVKSNVEQNKLTRESTGLFSIFSSLAKQNIDLAFDNLESFSSNRRQFSMAVSGLVQSLTTSDDFLHVLDKTKGLDNQDITQDIVRAWAKESPEDAVLWLDSIEDEKQQKQLEESVYRSWLYSDTDSAAESYMLSADSSNRQSRAQLVARTLSYSNPDKAISWLQQQSGIETDAMVQKVVQDSVRRNPEFASQHLNLITEPKEVIDSSVSIYMSLSRNSQTKADDFLADSPYRSEIEAKIVEREERTENSRRRNRP